MTTLYCTDPRFADHVVPAGHPERPARLEAVARGVAVPAIADSLVAVEPRLATLDELSLVHDPAYLGQLEAVCTRGGGQLDPDTTAVAASWEIARLAAGAGIDVADRLARGEADAAFLAVRPPGHHATPTRAMGFCLLNSVAITAASLAAAGERVLIVDIDAHHGNGTQDAFWDDPRVAYVSTHEAANYPGTGRAAEVGGDLARGTTLNLPLVSGAAGDTYRRAIDDVITPFVARFAPTWILISLGFDAHRADPLTDLGLTAGDYGDLLTRLVGLVPDHPPIVFLEGGYDLDAVASSTTASLAALAGLAVETEAISSGSVDERAIDASRLAHGL